MGPISTKAKIKNQKKKEEIDANRNQQMFLNAVSPKEGKRKRFGIPYFIVYGDLCADGKESEG